MTKEHILAEIRRTTEANGGTPLGVGRFFKETGIKASDWSGKYLEAVWWRRGEAALCEETTPDPVEEKFFVGLRMLDGVAADESDWARFGTVFERFLSDGMMERHGERLRLTPRGVMVSNEIFQEFLTV